MLLAICCLAHLATIAQTGFAEQPLSLEDNQWINLFWEPTGQVAYSETDTCSEYGLWISVRRSDDYLPTGEGKKIAIEFADGTKEVYEILQTDHECFTRLFDHRLIDVYDVGMLILPDFESLVTKRIQRIVIQLDNGDAHVINTKPKRAKKLLKEFEEAMQQAKASFQQKVVNNNYFETSAKLPCFFQTNNLCMSDIFCLQHETASKYKHKLRRYDGEPTQGQRSVFLAD